MSASVMFENAALSSVSPVAALRERQPALASVGFAFLTLFVVTAALPLFDSRMLDGVSVWAKPAKFFLSTGVFLLTSAFFFGYVRPERRASPALVWSVRIVIAAGVFELAYIAFQAAQGERSHFNRDDLAHSALYAMMGFAAIAMLATKVPLALEIWRRPVCGLDSALRLAVTLGVGLSVALGALTGLYMGQPHVSGHTVGAVGGAAPLFGWNRAGGDLRVAHFFGMHAEQMTPVVAVVARSLLGEIWAQGAAIAAAAAIAGLTVAVFAQAMLGRPFPLG
jgi:hypothetical protein